MERDEVLDVINESQLTLLRSAVKDLYYAAVWHADRPVDEQALWVAVRDAAGFKPGKSPVSIVFEGIKFTLDISRLRSIGVLMRKQKGIPEFTSEEARALLLLHGKELEDRLNKTVRDFVKEKL